MYTLTRNANLDYSYFIVLNNKQIGEVTLTEGKWTAIVGKITHTSSNRKRAVESVLNQIIMLFAAKVYKEKKAPSE